MITTQNLSGHVRIESNQDIGVATVILERPARLPGNSPRNSPRFRKAALLTDRRSALRNSMLGDLAEALQREGAGRSSRPSAGISPRDTRPPPLQQKTTTALRISKPVLT